MASLETLLSMICHSWTVPSILVRKNILTYEYSQTYLLGEKRLWRKSVFHSHNILKIPFCSVSVLTLEKITESLLVISLNIFANMVKRFESVMLLSHHVENIRKSCLTLNHNSIILEGL